MPTYSVTAPEGCLDADARARIAREITEAHNAATGAPTYFAQVIFSEVPRDRYFIGGVRLTGQQVFVNGQIRAGRSRESKDLLIARLVSGVADAARLPANNVWIYITDLLPQQMAEFGHVLPEPGDEARWTAALPEADRARMESFRLPGRDGGSGER